MKTVQKREIATGYFTSQKRNMTGTKKIILHGSKVWDLDSDSAKDNTQQG